VENVDANPQYFQALVIVTFDLTSDVCSSAPILAKMFHGSSIIIAVGITFVQLHLLE